jgi:sterol desaturase/sphingolipid hydroxylase (fatty acid hydroxylase superfamily)
MTVNYIALSIPVFFALIGVEYLVARRQGLEVYRFNDAITDLSCGVGQQVVAVLVKTALFLGYAYLYEQFRFVTYADGSLLPWVVAFLGVDFAYYWWHRLSHEVAFMWAVHVVHHQSEDYNLAVALRQAWFSGATSWVFYAPLALVGVPPLVFLTVASFSTLYQFWIHTRTIGKLGPAELVINTPSHHRVHHGRDPKYLDRNYGATLIVWDRLFGSFQEEEEEPRYGTVEAYGSWNPVWANFDFWAHLARQARAAPRLADKVKVWFMPPGWAPPGLAPHAPSDTVGEQRVRYATDVARGLGLYVALWFVPVVAATAWLMVSGSALPAGGAALAVGLVLATTLAFGALMEGRSWAVPFEIARLAAVAAVAGTLFVEGLVPAAALAAVSAVAAVSTTWLLWHRRGATAVVAHADGA